MNTEQKYAKNRNFTNIEKIGRKNRNFTQIGARVDKDFTVDSRGQTWIQYRKGTYRKEKPFDAVSVSPNATFLRE